MRLPETREQQQVAKGAAVIAIAPDGGLRFSPGDRDSRPVASLERLAVELRRMTAANLLHPFVIKADREVAYRAIDEVLEQLRLAGAQDVALLSRGERRP
jgi:biopolymer transport protein ExbD